MAYNNPQYNNNNNGYRRNNSGGGAARKKSDNVTTTGFNFENERAGKFLNVNYWGRTTQMEIGTCPAGVPMTWDIKKNAQRISQNISYGSLCDLSAIGEEVLVKIKETGNFTPMAIQAGSKNDCMVEISNGSNIGMPAGIYLVLYKGLDTGKRTNIMDIYPFTASTIYRNYDHNTGSAQEEISKVGEFKKFLRGINKSADAFTMAQAHVIAETEKTDKAATFVALSAITASLGIDLNTMVGRKPATSGSSTYQSKGYQNNGGGGYNRAPSSNNNYNRPPQQTFENAPTNQQLMGQINDEPVDINLDLSGIQHVTLDNFN